MQGLRKHPGGSLIHESSYIDEGAKIGSGTKVWHFCHVMGGAVIGERCSLGQNVVVMPGTRLGDNVKVQNNVSIYEGVECEDDVFLGPSMVFTNVINPRSHIPRKDEYRNTRVRRGATLGANCTIICGVTIGRYAFVGAGAVVTRDVPDYALVVGTPARRVAWMCECGNRIQFDEGRDGACRSCGRTYVKAGNTLAPVQPVSPAGE